MPNNDDYIKSDAEEAELGLAGTHSPHPRSDDDPSLEVTARMARETFRRLSALNWTHGLTRDQLREQDRDLPLGIYLHLPDSKRFTSPQEVFHEARIAFSRAEGEYLGANPDLPDQGARADGGPPAWDEPGDTYPIGGVVESGSAEDTEGLLPGDEPGEEPAN